MDRSDTTPFDDAGTTPNWTSWANQIDPLGERYSWKQWSDPLYTFGQPARGGVEFDPLPRGETYDAWSSLFGQKQIDADVDAWMRRAYPSLYQFSDVNRPTNPGAIASPGGEWATVDRWDNDVLTAIRKVATDTGLYVPANLVKAVMKLESQGNPNALSPSGAIGLMQVMPFWADSLGLNLHDPAQNILAGVTILAQNYNLGNPTNGEKSWEWAAKRYLGLGGEDALGTDNNEYWQIVANNWSFLEQNSDRGGTVAAPGTTAIQAIWGGIDADISQAFGWTNFSRANMGMYAYGADYTRDRQPMGHPGLDVGLAYGTNLYSPVAGTVVIAGGTGYYCDVEGNGCGPGVGQLSLQMDNGDIVILGHTSQITVRVGDRVTPGSFVGYSGSENGAHVHVEYRKWVGEGVTNSGYEQVNPIDAFQGIFTGSYGQGETGPTLAASASDWQGFMRAAAQGDPLHSGAATVGGWHDWLRQQMGVGSAPRVAVPEGPPTGWIFGAGQAPPPPPAGIGPR